MSEALDQAGVQTLKGVGPGLKDKLTRIGLLTLQDLLFHLPLRYEDRTRITAIGKAQIGSTIVIEGNILSCAIRFGRRRSLLAYIQDGSGTIALRFFHFSKAQQNNLKPGTYFRCFGEVSRGATGLEIYHPEYTMQVKPLEETLSPVYPTTEGISQKKFRSLVDQVLALMQAGKLLTNLGEQYPRLGAININQAILTLHKPAPSVDQVKLSEGKHCAQQRLAFEELLAHHISMRLLREEVQALRSTALKTPSTAYQQLLDKVGFTLTGAQQKVALELQADMQKTSPMLRLLQGDVGSGKTVIAALASIHAVENSLQAAIMAPTEILAEQHFVNFSHWLGASGIKTAWLSGKIKGKNRQAQLSLIASGEAQLVIGTHALFQKDVSFHNLGLVIIDEQHRFGVHQRLALREKGQQADLLPHQLIMTATPIPRTLTMSCYAAMDTSIIDELPPGRTPVTTSILADTRRDEVIAHIQIGCANGKQAYWVCTLIETSEVLECQAAESMAQQLSERLSGVRVGLVHGQMSAGDKSRIMTQFKQGQIDLLVATTVIEVGVDVPNASIMVIENPERLGLAQLHQLRGRIGRGSIKSFCLLLYHAPLSHISRQRLNVMRDSQDGFYIAEQDLHIRGPGELLGSRQSGAIQFKVADLVRDSRMLQEISLLTDELLQHDRSTALAIVRRWFVQPEKLSQV